MVLLHDPLERQQLATHILTVSVAFVSYAVYQKLKFVAVRSGVFISFYPGNRVSMAEVIFL